MGQFDKIFSGNNNSTDFSNNQFGTIFNDQDAFIKRQQEDRKRREEEQRRREQEERIRQEQEKKKDRPLKQKISERLSEEKKLIGPTLKALPGVVIDAHKELTTKGRELGALQLSTTAARTLSRVAASNAAKDLGVSQELVDRLDAYAKRDRQALETLQQEYAQNDPDTTLGRLTNLNYLARGVGQTVTAMIPAVGAGVVASILAVPATLAATAATVGMAPLIFGEAWEQSKAAGKSDEEADERAALTMVVVGALERVGLGKIFKPSTAKGVVNRIMGRIGESVPTEVVTENLQEFADVAIGQQFGEDKSIQDAIASIPEVTIQTTLATIAFSGGLGATQRQVASDPNTEMTVIEEEPQAIPFDPEAADALPEIEAAREVIEAAIPEEITEQEKTSETPEKPIEFDSPELEPLSLAVQEYDTVEELIEAVERGDIPPEYLEPLSKGTADQTNNQLFEDAQKFDSAEDFINSMIPDRGGKVTEYPVAIVTELHNKAGVDFDKDTQQEIEQKIIKQLTDVYKEANQQDVPKLRQESQLAIDIEVEGSEAQARAQKLVDQHKIDVSIQVFKRITDAIDSADLLGVMTNNKIGIAEKTVKFAGEHEVVHLVISNTDNIPHFNRFNRKDLLEDWKKQNNQPKMDDQQVEEQIAIQFEEYVAKQETSATGVVRQYFDALLDFVKKIVGASSSADVQAFYKELYSGKGKQTTKLPEKKNEGPGRYVIEETEGGRVLKFPGIVVDKQGIAQIFDRSVRGKDGKFAGSRPVVKADQTYQGEKDITTNILDKLKGRSTVSKQFISDLTNTPDLRQAERTLIRDVLSEYKDGKIPVKEFADKVRAQLLPLDTNVTSRGGEPRYESIVLPDESRGPVADYYENIYQSPIKNSAGDVHFGGSDVGGEVDGYFAHTRIEDLPAEGSNVSRKLLGEYDGKEVRGQEFGTVSDGRVGTTRRVIEIQSDLFQKGRLESEGLGKRDATPAILKQYATPEETRKWDDFSTRNLDNGLSDAEKKQWGELEGKLYEKARNDSRVGLDKLQPYRNTWHERIIREEVKRAAQDGKTTLQFPTGETAMKIEGLGDAQQWYIEPNIPIEQVNRTPMTELNRLYQNNRLSPEKLEVGQTVRQGGLAGQNWIITEVLEDGKFKAVPKNTYDSLLERFGQDGADDEGFRIILGQQRANETFDISGKADTDNPIYKFYEKDVQKFLRNKFGAKPVTDAQGVKWVEVSVDPKAADLPVPAFRQARKLDDAQIARLTEFYNKARQKAANTTQEKPSTDQVMTATKESVLNEMLASRAGERVFIEQADTMDLDVDGQKSTFPEWVPSHLRLSNIFDQVIGDVSEGKAPKPGTKRAELYEVVRNEINRREGLPPVKREELVPTREVAVAPGQLPVGEGAERATRLEARVRDLLGNLSEEQVNDIGPANYRQMNKKDQIKKASEYVVNNPKQALQVLRGEKDAPEGILSNSIFVAMQNLAKGDVELARQLSSLQSTRMGQEISILTEIDPNSPVKVMESIIRIREEVLQKRLGKKKSVASEKKRIAKEIKAARKPTSKNDWNSFISSLEC